MARALDSTEVTWRGSRKGGGCLSCPSGYVRSLEEDTGGPRVAEGTHAAGWRAAKAAEGTWVRPEGRGRGGRAPRRRGAFPARALPRRSPQPRGGNSNPLCPPLRARRRAAFHERWGRCPGAALR